MPAPAPIAAARARALARAEQGEFDFLVPTSKKLLTPGEVMRAIGREKDFVRELVEGQRLEAHQDTASGDGAKLSNRITTRSVKAYLAETALYRGEDHVSRVVALVRDLGPAGWEALKLEIARCERVHATR